MCVLGHLPCQYGLTMAASALCLQAVESPRQDDAAVERRLPEGMTQADHASDVALSDYQATPRVPAVSIAPGAQPQKRRPGRPPKKVRGAY